MTESQSSKNITFGSLHEYNRNLKNSLYNKDINLISVNNYCSSLGLNPVVGIYYLTKDEIDNSELSSEYAYYYNYPLGYVIRNNSLWAKLMDVNVGDTCLIFLPTTFKFDEKSSNALFIFSDNNISDDCYFFHDKQNICINGKFNLGFNLIKCTAMNNYYESMEADFEVLPYSNNYEDQLKTLIVNELPSNLDSNTLYYILEE